MGGPTAQKAVANSALSKEYANKQFQYVTMSLLCLLLLFTTQCSAL